MGDVQKLSSEVDKLRNDLQLGTYDSQNIEERFPAIADAISILNDEVACDCSKGSTKGCVMGCIGT